MDPNGIVALRIILLSVNVLGLIAWSIYSIEKYLEWPTASTVTLNYGDNGDNLVRFPVVTVCAMGFLKQNSQLCNKENKNIRFLASIQNCLEKDPNVNLREMMKNVSVETTLKSVQFKISLLDEMSDIKSHEKWNKEKDKVIYNHYDSKLGHCISIDIGPLYGKVPPKTIEEAATMKISLNWLIKNLKGFVLFLHNDSGIYARHDNMPVVGLRRFPLNSLRLMVKKKIVEFLPTKSKSCGKDHFETCIKNKIDEKLANEHKCYIPFLSYHKTLKECSNSVTLDAVKTWNYHITTFEDYETCQHIKPCHDIIYSVSEHPGSGGRDSSIRSIIIQFESKIVEIIKDSYTYTFLNLFAELGGVVGMLLGLSLFGILDSVVSYFSVHANQYSLPN